MNTPRKALAMYASGLIGATSLSRPEFGKAVKCHDWRNHVPGPIQDAWDAIAHDAKVCVHIMASERANDEEWE